MNYFEFFEIPVAFYLDEVALKQRFLKNSKMFHPDFYTLESEDKQAEILELATFNNQAYLTLSDFDKRLKYILELKGMLEDHRQTIPNEFLMEMMDINEAIMELEFDFDESAFETASKRVGELEAEILANAKPIMEAYTESSSNDASLETVKDFFLKKRYLWRIKEKLDSFAPASKEVR